MWRIFVFTETVKSHWYTHIPQQRRAKRAKAFADTHTNTHTFTPSNTEHGSIDNGRMQHKNANVYKRRKLYTDTHEHIILYRMILGLLETNRFFVCLRYHSQIIVAVVAVVVVVVVVVVRRARSIFNMFPVRLLLCAV